MEAKSRFSLWAFLIVALVLSCAPARAVEFGSFIYVTPDVIYGSAYTEVDYFDYDYGFDTAEVEAYMDGGSNDSSYGYLYAEVDINGARPTGMLAV
jgi:hypothetical protein